MDVPQVELEASHLFDVWHNVVLLFAVVERGDLQWETDEDFEVELVLDHCEDEVRVLTCNRNNGLIND